MTLSLSRCLPCLAAHPPFAQVPQAAFEAEISSWNIPGVVAPRHTTMYSFPELYSSPAWPGRSYEEGVQPLLLVQELELMRGGDLAQAVAHPLVSAAATVSCLDA